MAGVIDLSLGATRNKVAVAPLFLQEQIATEKKKKVMTSFISGLFNK
jgi:hypothetical protein